MVIRRIAYWVVNWKKHWQMELESKLTNNFSILVKIEAAWKILQIKKVKNSIHIGIVINTDWNQILNFKAIEVQEKRKARERVYVIEIETGERERELEKKRKRADMLYVNNINSWRICWDLAKKLYLRNFLLKCNLLFLGSLVIVSKEGMKQWYESIRRNKNSIT